MFILGLIALVLALLLVFVGFFFARARSNDLRRREELGRVSDSDIPKGLWFFISAGILAVVGVILTIFSMTFTVDTGSSTVLKDWTGVVQEDSISSPGIHTKAPWQNDIPWDVKNQDSTFTGDGSTGHNGQTVSGPEITVIDKDGISANMDIQVLFSIKPDSVVDLTKGYANQDDFEIKVVENYIKSIPRDVASQFTTVEMFEERTRLKADITKELEKAFKSKGVIVDNVNIHGIRYPKDVQQRFKDAQNAQTDLLKAETDAQTAKTKAEGQAQAEIAKATGEAEANRLLTQSLTPEVLQQRWIDALKGANTIIVPQDFTSLGNLPQQ